MSPKGCEKTKDDNGHDLPDKPRPMKDCKPVKMNPNSVDRFWQSHRAEYEGRGYRGSDIDRVHRHNAAYPLLRDELDKRKSIAKVTAIGTKKNHKNFNLCACERCLKIRKTNFKSIDVHSSILHRRSSGEQKSKFARRRKKRDNLSQYACFDCLRKLRTVYQHSGRGSKRSIRLKKLEKGTNTDNIARKLFIIDKHTGSSKEQSKRTNERNDPQLISIERAENAKNNDEKYDNNYNSDCSSASKEFIRKYAASNATSVATEPSMPSHHSSSSLGLEDQPMER